MDVFEEEELWGLVVSKIVFDATIEKGDGGIGNGYPALRGKVRGAIESPPDGVDLL